MANFSKILGLASTAFVFAGMAFGQNASCSSAAASQTPLIRVEGTTELVGEYVITCTGGAGTANILDIVSLPVTSKALTTSSTGITEAVAVVSVGGNIQTAAGSVVQGTVSGSQLSFAGVNIPSGASTITIANVRVNATSLTVGTGTPPAITESAFISGTSVNSAVTGSATVGYAFTGLSTQTAYKSTPNVSGASKGSNSFLVCQGYKGTAGLVAFIDVGENFATAFKGIGPGAPGAGTMGGTPPPATANNSTLGSEFNNNTETGFTGITGGTNVASSGTLLQVVFSNIPAQVTSLFVPITVVADQSLASTPTLGTGTLTLVTSPSNLTTVTASTSSSAPSATGAVTIASGGGTAYYLFTPGTASSTTTETFAIADYIVQSANSTTATTGSMSAVVSFAPIGSTQIPNFVIGPSSTTTTLSTFTQCTTSLLFPFVTNQLGFDTGLAIANTSTDPFGSNGATPQAGTCTVYFYGAGAPTPNSVVTPSVPSATVYTNTVSALAPGFQGYAIAQCNFQFAHGFAFLEDGLGTGAGITMGYLAGVIPDTNQLKRTAANPIGVATAGMGETLGN